MKISLFIVVFFILFKPFFPVVEYAVNFDYISKVLCINQDKPEMDCKGKCYLKKQIAKSSDVEKPNSDQKKSSHSIEYLFCENFERLVFLENIFLQTFQLNTIYQNLYSFSHYTAIFIPPQILV